MSIQSMGCYKTSIIHYRKVVKSIEVSLLNITTNCTTHDMMDIMHSNKVFFKLTLNRKIILFLKYKCKSTKKN